MPIDGFSSLAPLPPLPPLAPLQTLESPQTQGVQPAGGGFATILNGMLERNAAANEAANDAVKALASGEAQDLHTVSLAVMQSELSFRTILQIRNRLSDALQEITRMQV